MENLDYLLDDFEQLYGKSKESMQVYFAPGRVNIIGEHTDYNGGFVFPAALDFGTYMVIRRRNDRIINFSSNNFSFKRSVSLDNIEYDTGHGWTNYPKGIIYHLAKRGYELNGYDILYCGNIPNGAGLSSSASIQLVTAFGLLTYEGYDVDRVEIARIAQESENRFIGVNVGIMDQFVVSLGKKNHALLINCNTLDYELVPFDIGDYRIVISNSNKKRELVDSEYNTRRQQCEIAVKYMKTQFCDISNLSELSKEDFDSYSYLIKDDVARNRAFHVINENERVLKSVQALKSHDIDKLGGLMTESHESLRELYQVSCRELDLLVDTALGVDGVMGSRMTGAGFGGCTVSLVLKANVDDYKRIVGSKYRSKFGHDADFYVCNIGDGVKQIKED
ncbi:galactokinase [Brassicibacter mesophilus]|uniref:galactokinase n=1 Tax=Brassicibacter mesophilus TaxID=745119 RepID=UPI003D2438FA